MDRSPRSADSRSADLRPELGAFPEDAGILYVPLDQIPDNVELRWVRESTLGARDRSNLQYAMQREGFKPVLSGDFPSIAPPQLPGDTEADTLIRNGGLILMQRPKEMADQAKRRHAQDNRDALQAVKHEFSGKMDDRNFKVDSESGIEVETERNGRVRTSRSSFKE